MPASAPRKFEIWPWAITLFLIVFAAALVGYAVFAGFNKAVLVSPDYYNQEIQYQKRIDSIKRTQALTEKPRLLYQADQKQLVLQFPASLETDSVTGTITLYRPSDAGMDQIFALRLSPSLSQVIDTADLTPGLWRIKLEWARDEWTYFQEQVLVIEN